MSTKPSAFTKAVALDSLAFICMIPVYVIGLVIVVLCSPIWVPVMAVEWAERHLKGRGYR